jgi:serine-type D-Ala-D-Ala carboxypeptidase (penicillin-binding protein 5/6)
MPVALPQKTRKSAALLAACCLLAAPAAAIEPPPNVTAQSWILVDAGRAVVLGAKNADQRRPVASTQKLMTALLVVERGGLNDLVTVDRSDTLVAPTKVGLKTGQQIKRIELLKSLLIKSGNDIAHCLGRDHSGSEARFAEAMTRRARELRMMDTQFRNASGLPDPEQFSTARDMARLALFIYRSGEAPDKMLHRTIIGITRMPSMVLALPDGRKLTLTNTNRLLARVPGCNGMKTGYTNASGRCLISSVNRDGRHLIAVVLGSTSQAIWNDSQSILEWGLRH